MSQMTAGQIEKSVRGILLSGSPHAPISGISIDSRTVQPGDLFFAIRGPNNDGHRYLQAALQRGSCGAVVDYGLARPTDCPGDTVLIQVKDTHRALKDLATEVRALWRGSLVAITGSVGKTTTKEFTAHVLQSEFSVYRSPGNYNNLFGVPLSIFGLREEDHIGVFEMGMSERGEIAELCSIARPDVGVITSVAAAHLKNFNSLEEVALAKGELADALEPGGTLIYNADDPLVQQIADRFRGSRVSFGQCEDADVRVTDIDIAELGVTRFNVTVQRRRQRAVLPLAGIHYVLNAAAAMAVGLHYRLSVDVMIDCLKDLRQQNMRGKILRFKEGFTLIDDSYNSNPRALMLMTENLSRFKSGERRILVAGEMLELGDASREMHRQCGAWAARCGIDMVVALQGDAEELARGAAEGGIPGSHIRFFSKVEDATSHLMDILRPGDLVLVKGSRSVHLEKLVQAVSSQYHGEKD